jgi:hypothetical protein
MYPRRQGEFSFGRERDTIAVKGNLLNRARIIEEVEVYKGDLLTAGVPDHSLDPGVVDLAQGDIQSWGFGRKSQSAMDKGQNGRSESSEFHDGGLDEDCYFSCTCSCDADADTARHAVSSSYL